MSLSHHHTSVRWFPSDVGFTVLSISSHSSIMNPIALAHLKNELLKSSIRYCDRTITSNTKQHEQNHELPLIFHYDDTIPISDFMCESGCIKNENKLVNDCIVIDPKLSNIKIPEVKIPEVKVTNDLENNRLNQVITPPPTATKRRIMTRSRKRKFNF